MKAILPIILFAALITTSCVDQEAQKAAQKQTQDSLLQVQQDSLLDVFKGELDVIASKVREVSTRNGIFNIDTSEGQILSKEQILEQVSSMDELLNSKQQELSDLYKRMRASKVKNDELEKMIKSMQDRLTERESQIDDLMKMLAEKDLKIDQILERVDSMRITNVELTEEVAQMDEAMHIVYYVIGESKELKEKGIITKEGGILGLGGSKKLDVSQLDEGLFKQADKRELKSIPLFSKKAKLITNHPESSYAFTMDSNGGVESLEINNSDRFWTATDYLVIEVDN